MPFGDTSAETDLASISGYPAACDVNLADGEAATGCGSAGADESFTESTGAVIWDAGISGAKAVAAGWAFVSGGGTEDVVIGD